MCSRTTMRMRAAVLASLAEDEGAVQPSQIQAELPSDPGLATVAYHLKTLKGAGLVDQEGDRYKLPRPAGGCAERRGEKGAADGQGPSTLEA